MAKRVRLNMDKIFGFCALNGVSLKEFCEEIGVHRQNITSWKNGTSPSPLARRKIETFTGLSADELYEEADGIQRGRFPVG